MFTVLILTREGVIGSKVSYSIVQQKNKEVAESIELVHIINILVNTKIYLPFPTVNLHLYLSKHKKIRT